MECPVSLYLRSFLEISADADVLDIKGGQIMIEIYQSLCSTCARESDSREVLASERGSDELLTTLSFCGKKLEMSLKAVPSRALTELQYLQISCREVTTETSPKNEDHTAG